MLRRIATIAMIALAVPTLVLAQGYEERHPGGRPPPGAYRGPHPGGPPGRFMFRGRPFHPIHVVPFVYPHGWAYRRWVIGATLPALFLAPAYYYAGWAELGLPPPEPGFQWVRYGPDLLLVNVATGQVVDVVNGAFY
jgi:Nickel/cobalt transporter regulator